MSLLGIPGFARLWVAGAIANALLWLEVLAAGLFTLAATGSPLAVAVVSAARGAPLLLAGAWAGVLSDAVDRRLIVVGGLLLTAASSGAVALLAAGGLLQPWHVGIGQFVSGFVYATEMPARKRLIVELASGEQTARAVATDNLTSFATRCAGPLLGGVAVQAAGLGWTFAASACLSLAGAVLVWPVRHRQGAGAATAIAAWRDLREGLRYAGRSRVVAALLAVTVVMNLLGYSYTTLVAPLGRAFGLDAAATGVLAAAEPAGSLLGGLLLVAHAVRRPTTRLLAAGSAGLLAALALAPWVPPLWPVCVLLVLGGLGSSLFTNMQSGLVMVDAPVVMRSRVFGLVSMGIGCWPLGQLLAGAAADRLGPVAALSALAMAGLVMLAAIATVGRLSRPAGSGGSSPARIEA